MVADKVFGVMFWFLMISFAKVFADWICESEADEVVDYFNKNFDNDAVVVVGFGEWAVGLGAA